MLYEIEVQLQYIDPPIWRILRLPSRTSLLKFHKILQRTMGWKNSHLHLFDVDGKRYGELPAEWEFEVFDSRKMTLDKIFSGGVKSFFYDYDMGDDWRHRITLMGTVEGEGEEKPACIAGARACPPEDCGGPPGYENLMEALLDPQHDEHDELLNWVGEKYDPEAFDVEVVDLALKRLH